MLFYNCLFSISRQALDSVKKTLRTGKPVGRRGHKAKRPLGQSSCRRKELRWPEMLLFAKQIVAIKAAICFSFTSGSGTHRCGGIGARRLIVKRQQDRRMGEIATAMSSSHGAHCAKDAVHSQRTSWRVQEMRPKTRTSIAAIDRKQDDHGSLPIPSTSLVAYVLEVHGA